MSFKMLYEIVRDRNKRQLQEIHTKDEVVVAQAKSQVKTMPPPTQNWGSLFYSEFRFIILTVLIVVAALTLQQTVEDALNEFVRKRLKSPVIRICGMFALSIVIVFVVIVITIVWKPHTKKPVVVNAPLASVEEETTTSKDE
jgi:hypothetical protein